MLAAADVTKKYHKQGGPYPKEYATVIKVPNDGTIVVRRDNGKYDLTLDLRWRCGKGACGSSPTGQFDFGKGTRVKVYWPAHRRHPKFRRVGS